MREPNPAEKMLPSPRGLKGECVDSVKPLGGFHCLYQGDEGCGDRDGERLGLSSLRAGEGNGGDTCIQIDAGKRDAGLSQPAACMEANQEAVTHPLWFVVEGRETDQDFLVGEGGLLGGGCASELHGCEGIRGDDVPANGFGEDGGEELDFTDGGVAACAFSGASLALGCAPSDVIFNVGVADVGHVQVEMGEVGADPSPRFRVAFERARSDSERMQIEGNPIPSPCRGGLMVFLFFVFCSKRTSFEGVVGAIVTQSGGCLDPFSVRFVSDIPVNRIWSFEERSHVGHVGHRHKNTGHSPIARKNK